MDNIWILVAASLIIPGLSVLLAFISMRKTVSWRVDQIKENEFVHLKDDLKQDLVELRSSIGTDLKNMRERVNIIEGKIDNFIMSHMELHSK